MGITAGKLIIAMSVELLEALDAIEDTKVKITENPMPPKPIAVKKSLKSFTGLSAIKLKSKKVRQLNALISSVL